MQPEMTDRGGRLNSDDLRDIWAEDGKQKREKLQASLRCLEFGYFAVCWKNRVY